LRAVILLGNDDGYVSGVRSTIKALYPDGFKVFNPMTYEAGGKVWVHAAHPSGSNGHLGAWLDATSCTKRGAKAIQAISALA